MMIDVERHESFGVLTAKAAIYAVAVVLYLLPLATIPAMITAVLALSLAIGLAEIAERRGLRIWAGIAFALLAALLGLALSRAILHSGFGWSAKGAIQLADSAYFGLLALGGIFGLRLLANRARVFSALEVAFVIGAAAYTFHRHRNQMIHRPRWLTDWAWSQGIDPQLLLTGVGVVAVVLAMMMLLRYQRPLKLAVSLLFLLLVGATAWWFQKDLRLDTDVDTGGLALTSDEQDKGKPEPGKGKPDDGKSKPEDGKGGKGGEGKPDKDGKGGGAGSSSNPLADPPPPPKVIVPVAVAVFRDDHEPRGNIFYFRQQTLSRYNGHHLAAVTDDTFDRDVITDFPHESTQQPGEATQGEPFHVRVPTSMYLLSDHPQPLALTSSIELQPEDNPNPRHFVAAYKAISLALTTNLRRLVGRRSVPADWSDEKREHYTTVPDDPRYESLADEIARETDPRFLNDDLMTAVTIKGWLEKEGFYTRKEKHQDDVDPAASFLFGTRRGYCVHFAHAAVYLFRSQGIAARVALGYAVDTSLRSGGGSVLILSDRAHAWPEIHIDGVGWMTFDIYPERSDEPEPQLVDHNLERVLGELARRDPRGGKAADPEEGAFDLTLADIGRALGLTLGGLLLLAFFIKIIRRLSGRVGAGRRAHVRAFRAALDHLADLGLIRAFGESRERYAARLQSMAPSLVPLTTAHLRLALGRVDNADVEGAGGRALGRQVRDEVGRHTPLHKRILAILNPIGWLFTR